MNLCPVPKWVLTSSILILLPITANYIALFFLPDFSPELRAEGGCFTTNAMIPYVECAGDGWWNALKSDLLNLWFFATPFALFAFPHPIVLVTIFVWLAAGVLFYSALRRTIIAIQRLRRE